MLLDVANILTVSPRNGTSLYLRLGVLVCLTGLLVSGGSFASKAWAYSYRKQYIPPEILNHRHYQTRIRMPNGVNLNQASLEELKTLPGMDESTGLKIIRIRPLKNIQDLERLPLVPPQRIQRLIYKIQPLSRF